MHKYTKASFFGLLAFTSLALLHSLDNTNTLLSPALLHFLLRHQLLLLSLLWCISISVAAYIYTRPRPILLLDYSCFRPEGSDRRCSLEMCEYFGLGSRRFSETSADFMRAIYRKSGLGDETYGPPFIFQSDYDAKLQYAIKEAEDMCPTAASLLKKTAVDPSQITHLIVACSMFSFVPSLSTLIINHFNLDESVKSYNLSGMGCSAGTLAFDLASQLLSGREIGYALIVVTESTGLNWYFGDNRHMLVTNCIFRCGTAAALVTNDPKMRYRAKMELVRTLRTHHGADDTSYNAAIQQEDEEGNVGVALTKDLVRVAGNSLKNHISTLAPRVLPVAELLRYVYSVARSYVGGDRKAAAAHVPDFTTAFEHMCIHAGGKAVIDAVGRLMKFDAEIVEPARMCLHRFGNTSSSLVFYELAYFEAKRRIKEGDRVWMLAFGTGFKACSVVWRALRDSLTDPDNPWNECIHRYPI